MKVISETRRSCTLNQRSTFLIIRMNYPQHTNCTFSFCSSAEWRQIRGLHEYDGRRCLIIVSTEEIYFAENRIDGVMFSMLASSVVDRGFIGGVMVSVLVSSEVDRGFIGGVMVSVLASSVVDRGFIGGVMVSMLASSAVDRGFIGGVMFSMLASSAIEVGFIGGVMVCVLASCVADRGFQSLSDQANKYKH